MYTNYHNYQQVLQGLKTKSVLLEQTVTEIEGCLKERDISADLGFSSPINDYDTYRSRTTNGNSTANRLDKRQIEQRIEEDRERHKRMRESMWVVPASLEGEATKILDETSDYGDDDETFGREERDEFLREVEANKCDHIRSKEAAEAAAVAARGNGASSH